MENKIMKSYKDIITFDMAAGLYLQEKDDALKEHIKLFIESVLVDLMKIYRRKIQRIRIKHALTVGEHKALIRSEKNEMVWSPEGELAIMDEIDTLNEELVEYEPMYWEGDVAVDDKYKKSFTGFVIK